MPDLTKSRCQDGIWGWAPVCPKCLDSSFVMPAYNGVNGSVEIMELSGYYCGGCNEYLPGEKRDQVSQS